MSNDTYDAARAEMTAEINAEAAERQKLEEKYGQVWNTEEVQKEFTVTGFGAPFVSVTRKSDGQKGSLTFQHAPRYYFDFQPL